MCLVRRNVEIRETAAVPLGGSRLVRAFAGTETDAGRIDAPTFGTPTSSQARAMTGTNTPKNLRNGDAVPPAAERPGRKLPEDPA